jgi:DNA modification methylase
MENITLHNGDSAEVLKQYPDNHFDSVVTDPPYGIEFLGKDWDSNTGAIEVWQECLRVLKPGGYMLAFSAARTYHRLAVNLEDVGFEIKDQIMWLYGSGFPKAQDIGKKSGNDEWAGWKTGLKPAHEPIVMCRKPLDNKMGKRGPMKSRLSVVENVEKWGVGALNIDDTRIEFTDNINLNNKLPSANNQFKNKNWVAEDGKVEKLEPIQEYNPQGRFPSNVIISEEVGKELDEKIGNKKFGNKKGGYKYDKTYNVEGFINNNKPDAPSNYGDGGGVSKYFYSPKVNRKERHNGLFEDSKDIPIMFAGDEGGGANAVNIRNNITGYSDLDKYGGEEIKTSKDNTLGNNHPTVKPVALMNYLVTLITPPNGKVLDPFNGSGSTGMAVKEFGGEYTGIDLDENYIEISRKRIDAWDNK